LIHIVGSGLSLHNIWLSDDRRRSGREIWDELLNVLRNDESRRFSHLVINDESRFPSRCESTHSDAKFVGDVSLRTKTTLARKTALATIFFTGTKLLVRHAVSRRKKFNQYHFLATTAPELPGKAQRPRAGLTTTHYSGGGQLDLSESAQIQEHFARKSMKRVPHPVCCLVRNVPRVLSIRPRDLADTSRPIAHHHFRIFEMFRQ
jgi:hypothetical protein